MDNREGAFYLLIIDTVIEAAAHQSFICCSKIPKQINPKK
jgi:hypothetical protein